MRNKPQCESLAASPAADLEKHSAAVINVVPGRNAASISDACSRIAFRGSAVSSRCALAGYEELCITHNSAGTDFYEVDELGRDDLSRNLGVNLYPPVNRCLRCIDDLG